MKCFRKLIDKKGEVILLFFFFFHCYSVNYIGEKTYNHLVVINKFSYSQTQTDSLQSNITAPQPFFYFPFVSSVHHFKFQIDLSKNEYIKNCQFPCKFGM